MNAKPRQVRGSKIRKVRFIESGIVSLIVEVEDQRSVEVGLIGREGFIATEILLGADTFGQTAQVQSPLRGQECRLKIFHEIISDCPKLRRRMLRYTLSLHRQVAQVASCNRHHSIEQRLARWLVLMHDRLEEDAPVPLTHELLARMIGTGRSEVSHALGSLQKQSLVSQQRGKIWLNKPTGLEAVSRYATVFL